jgi:hypothetical protein
LKLWLTGIEDCYFWSKNEIIPERELMPSPKSKFVIKSEYVLSPHTVSEEEP